MNAADAVQQELRRSVLLSVQRALVGEVTREMRAIEVVLTTTQVLLRVFIDGDLSEALQDDFDAGAITQIVADFPCPEEGDPVIVCEFVRCDSPEAIPVEGILVHGLSGVRYVERRTPS